MNHGRNKAKLSRTSAHRQALLKNLTISLLKFGYVETTLAKAKAMRPFAEKLITRGKNMNLYNRKILLSKLFMNKEAVNLIENWSAKHKDRSGGYLRIIKNGSRYGDGAQTSVIEFVK